MNQLKTSNLEFQPLLRETLAKVSPKSISVIECPNSMHKLGKLRAQNRGLALSLTHRIEIEYDTDPPILRFSKSLVIVEINDTEIYSNVKV